VSATCAPCGAPTITPLADACPRRAKAQEAKSSLNGPRTDGRHLPASPLS
jgi:hypothetical protein